VAQGGEAFRRDCIFAITDYTDEALRLDRPIHCIQGNADNVVPLTNIEQFARTVPKVSFESVDGAGQFLMMTHWQYVLKALCNRQHRWEYQASHPA
jgi:pimeloyl-ACP methyl ester carboxylesterase